jgi:uncharacterized membrane protein
MIRLRASWEYLRGTYWAVPSAMAVAALLLAAAVIELDEVVTAALLDRWSWVYTGGPEGARAVLSTIAGSMITVAGVTFSITIVALTLASQQFGPRLLRNFLRDLGNQIVLGTFVSTYLYCLLVLRTIRGTDDVEFVPHLAVTLGVGLAMLSLGVLIFFIHHVATSIQASRIIARVAVDLEAAAGQLFPERLGAGESDIDVNDGDALPAAAGDASRRICAATSGYVQAIDADRLLDLTSAHDVRLDLHTRPGAFLRAGAPLMTIYASTFPEGWTDEPFRGVVIVGTERTGTQDIEFFISQLVELAVRALSPGINDPATVRSCIDRLEHTLCELASRRFPSPRRYDADRTLRVTAPPVTFAALVESAFLEIGRYGAASVSVTCRLLEALGTIAGCVSREEHRRPVSEQAMAVVERSRVLNLSSDDRARVEARYQALLEVLGRVDPARHQPR